MVISDDAGDSDGDYNGCSYDAVLITIMISW